MDACHCCHECKKGPGEKCGGLFNLDGICGDGLVCHRNKNHSEDIFDLNGICLSK
ncbi:Single insulin-like growth factor-binding domain protein-2 [Armadillidium vulgare]|nr:Single insulin-like growth factor-binding domain protein-2 [Armadillidium vulgare]